MTTKIVSSASPFSRSPLSRFRARLNHALIRRRLVVTAEDLAAGHPGNAAECPVALAAQRLFGTREDGVILVSGQEVTVREHIRLRGGDLVERTIIERWRGGEALRNFVLTIDGFEAHEITGFIPSPLVPTTFTLRLWEREVTEY